MSDLHQVNSIIATAIVNCEFDATENENKIGVEKAKHMAKRIITALTDAGLEIVPTTKKS